MKVPFGVFSEAKAANSDSGVTVTVTVAFDIAGTVICWASPASATPSPEKVSEIPAPAQFCECSRKRPSSTISESAWPPRV